MWGKARQSGAVRRMKGVDGRELGNSFQKEQSFAGLLYTVFRFLTGTFQGEGGAEVVRAEGVLGSVGPQVGLEGQQGVLGAAQTGQLVVAEGRLESTFGKEAND